MTDMYIGRGKNFLDDYCLNPGSYTERDVKFGKRNPKLEKQMETLIA